VSLLGVAEGAVTARVTPGRSVTVIGPHTLAEHGSAAGKPAVVTR
jgi:hypothetical protein